MNPENQLGIEISLILHKEKRPRNLSLSLERKTGLGPATPTLARLCSTNWATSAFTLVLKSDAKIRHFFYPANFRTSFLPIFFKILDFYGFYLYIKDMSSGIKTPFSYITFLRDAFGIRSGFQLLEWVQSTSWTPNSSIKKVQKPLWRFCTFFFIFRIPREHTCPENNSSRPKEYSRTRQRCFGEYEDLSNKCSTRCWRCGRN